MNEPENTYTISRDEFDAVIFDLDGVVTDTASVHAAAWRKMFDQYLSARASAEGVQFQPFDPDADYRLFVDGKPRSDGVRSFLQSRGIVLSEGRTDDPPGAETVVGMGKLKNGYFLARIEEKGVDVYETTVELLRELRRRGFRTAIISASRNCAMILKAVNLQGLFDARVDGDDAEAMGFQGKPAPDIFLEAARRLDVAPERALVIEDALAGVRAGRAGGFGLVVGVDRHGDGEALRQAGADVVVKDLSGIKLR